MHKLPALLLPFMAACMIFSSCGTTAPQSSQEERKTEKISSEETPKDSEPESQPEEEKAGPIYGSQIKDGTYPIQVSSSSSMFRIIEAQLLVENGDMQAVLTLSGKGYGKLYMGTGEEALTDTEDHTIPFEENEAGQYTYTVPVPALNQEIDCAAWSIKKEKWYDRILVFLSDGIPAEALSQAPASIEGQYSIVLTGGQYSIPVTLSGGTGRVGIQSPAKVTISPEGTTAVLIWDSPYYVSMEVNGISYEPAHSGETSIFEIPVILEQDIPVSATTIAMSTPHEIEYTLHFDAASAKPAG
ncbi:hypothetical protein D7Y09_05910 [bacterium 1XD42-1]|nr:hypothetical protein D7X25_03800 [bacterium 1XD42-8]RKJ65589.1 hypothetical protein D7Y09_05910 [bacterium 1XD42-1]